jgi:hypothetical protein
MGWYDSTNAILGIKQEERAKKNDRWSKIMDLANAGVDIWSIISGRKYQTGERIGAQDFAASQSALDRLHQDTSREDTQAYNTSERIAGQEYSTGERVAGQGFTTTQNELDRQLSRDLSAASLAAQMGDKAEKRMSFLAEWTQRAYELAVSNPSFLDVNGVFDPAKREALRKFLYTQVDNLPILEADEIAWAKQSFDGFVDGLGGSPSNTVVKDPAAVTPRPSNAELISAAKATVEKLRSMAIPAGAKAQVDSLEKELALGDKPPSAGHGVTDIQAILTKLTTLYNMFKYNQTQGGSGQAQDDLRLTK